MLGWDNVQWRWSHWGHRAAKKFPQQWLEISTWSDHETHFNINWQEKWIWANWYSRRMNFKLIPSFLNDCQWRVLTSDLTWLPLTFTVISWRPQLHGELALKCSCWWYSGFDRKFEGFDPTQSVGKFPTMFVATQVSASLLSCRSFLCSFTNSRILCLWIVVTGNIPLTLGHCVNIVRLDLSHNDLTGGWKCGVWGVTL